MFHLLGAQNLGQTIGQDGLAAMRRAADGDCGKWIHSKQILPLYNSFSLCHNNTDSEFVVPIYLFFQSFIQQT
jgi:hypothetical protein